MAMSEVLATPFMALAILALSSSLDTVIQQLVVSSPAAFCSKSERTVLSWVGKP